jgi:hypothetical protein
LFMHKVGVNNDENGLDWGVDTAACRTQLRARATNLFLAGAQSASTSSTANTTAAGWYGVNRIVSTQYKRFINALTATISNTSVGLQNASIKAGHGAAISTVFTQGGYDFLSAGGGFADEQAAFLAVQTAYAQFLAQAAVAE